MMSSFMIRTPHQIFLGRSNQEEWDGRGMWHVWGIGEMPAGFWWGNVMEGDYLKNLGLDGKIILKWMFNNEVGRHALGCSG